jgi:hypothetical protein
MSRRAYLNTTMVKALEEVDEKLAEQVMSDPNLGGKELSEVLQASLTGEIVNKNNGEPMKLSNKVMMAGFRNKLNQLIDKVDRE